MALRARNVFGTFENAAVLFANQARALFMTRAIQVWTVFYPLLGFSPYTKSSKRPDQEAF